jgi:hypothetical protein
LVKKSGKRLKLAQIPVPASDQGDGMDRTLAIANAVGALTGADVRLPSTWELVEIDTETGEVLERQPEAATPEAEAAAAATPSRRRRDRGRHRP